MEIPTCCFGHRIYFKSIGRLPILRQSQLLLYYSGEKLDVGHFAATRRYSGHWVGRCYGRPRVDKRADQHRVDNWTDQRDYMIENWFLPGLLVSAHHLLLLQIVAKFFRWTTEDCGRSCCNCANGWIGLIRIGHKLVWIKVRLVWDSLLVWFILGRRAISVRLFCVKWREGRNVIQMVLDPQEALSLAKSCCWRLMCFHSGAEATLG